MLEYLVASTTGYLVLARTLRNVIHGFSKSLPVLARTVMQPPRSAFTSFAHLVMT